MRLTWTQRLAAQPEYRDINTWPFIDVQTLPAAKRALFLRNRQIAAQALVGQRSADIAAQHGIDRTGVSKLMSRCLAGDDADDPALTQGLIPNVPLRVKGRRTPLSSLQQRTGARGAFTALLERLPSVREGLDALIRPAVKRLANGENVMPKGFHKDFIRLLHEAQWPTDQYPFTEASRAYESARQYWHRRCDELRMPTKKSTRVIRTVHPDVRIFDDIHIDEHSYDAHGRIDLDLDGQYIPLRVGRISVARMVYVASDCRLAFQLCLTQHPTQFDLLALLNQVHERWEPLALTTPGLSYLPGACFPSALGAPYTHAGLGIVRLDNALVHTAHTVRNYLCHDQGATLNLGLVGQPKGRNVVEHAFDLLSDQAKRLPSTTGAHPRDPLREAHKHQKKAPRITVRGLEEQISINLTEHNVTPQARLGGQTPLAIMRHQMENTWPRLLPDELVRRLNPFRFRQSVPVHWLKHEHRAPFINFEYLRYNGDCLCNVGVVREPIVVEGDRRDIRVLTAYRLTGDYLGELRAPLSWQRYPHSIETRRYVHQLARKERLAMRDPLGEYFAYQLEHREQPRRALEMLRVYREFNRGTITFGSAPTSMPIVEPTVNSTDSPTRDASRRVIPDWSPTLAARGHHHAP